MKKICYIVTVPETIEAFFIPQLIYLRENGFDVTVICSNADRLQKKIRTINLVTIDIPRGVSIIKTITSIIKLCFVFRKERYDLIQYSTPNAALCASIAGWISRIPKRNYHIMGFRYLGERGIAQEILKILEKMSCVLSTSIECVSKSNLEFAIRERLFKREKAVVVWNGSSGGVDLCKFNYANREKYRQQIRKKYNIAPEEFVFGFVGRITKDKGINEILKAFEKIDCGKLLMIGKIECADSLDRDLYYRSLNNKSIIYAGQIANVEQYYAALDVLLLPSYREGFGNVIIEAGAMGTPAIVSDIPGPIDAVIANKTALIVPPRNVYSLYLAMKEIMNLNYKQMGNEAAVFVKNSFSTTILNQYILNRKRYLLYDNSKIKKMKSKV